MKAREEIKWFAEQMERRLAENDLTRGAVSYPRVAPKYLLDRLGHNYQDLCVWMDDLDKIDKMARRGEAEAADVMIYAEEALERALDVSNYAMMVGDKIRNALLGDLRVKIAQEDRDGEEAG